MICMKKQTPKEYSPLFYYNTNSHGKTSCSCQTLRVRIANSKDVKATRRHSGAKIHIQTNRSLATKGVNKESVRTAYPILFLAAFNASSSRISSIVALESSRAAITASARSISDSTCQTCSFLPSRDAKPRVLSFRLVVGAPEFTSGSFMGANCSCGVANLHCIDA